MATEHLHAAIKSLRAGDRREARRLLGIALRVEPDNISAWWYLAEALDDPLQKSQCLRQVLRLHPDHAQARRMLGEIERRVVKVTPPEGFARPVFDARDQDGKIIIPDSDGDAPPLVKAHKAPSSTLSFTLVVVATVALIMVTGGIILFQPGILRHWPGVRESLPPATPRSLLFDVQDCASTGQPETTLEFVNNTHVTLDVLQGQPGQEIGLLTLEPGQRALVQVEPGLQVRYAARTDAPDLADGGAIIEVPRGSRCRVPIE